MSIAKSPQRPDTRQAQVQAQATTARTPAAPDGNKLRELTEKLAYDLYETRGRADGHDFDDWLTAEKAAREKLSET